MESRSFTQRKTRPSPYRKHENKPKARSPADESNNPSKLTVVSLSEQEKVPKVVLRGAPSVVAEGSIQRVMECLCTDSTQAGTILQDKKNAKTFLGLFEGADAPIQICRSRRGKIFLFDAKTNRQRRFTARQILRLARVFEESEIDKVVIEKYLKLAISSCRGTDDVKFVNAQIDKFIGGERIAMPPRKLLGSLDFSKTKAQDREILQITPEERIILLDELIFALNDGDKEFIDRIVMASSSIVDDIDRCRPKESLDFWGTDQEAIEQENTITHQLLNEFLELKSKHEKMTRARAIIEDLKNDGCIVLHHDSGTEIIEILEHKEFSRKKSKLPGRAGALDRLLEYLDLAAGNAFLAPGRTYQIARCINESNWPKDFNAYKFFDLFALAGREALSDDKVDAAGARTYAKTVLEHAIHQLVDVNIGRIFDWLKLNESDPVPGPFILQNWLMALEKNSSMPDSHRSRIREMNEIILSKRPALNLACFDFSLTCGEARFLNPEVAARLHAVCGHFQKKEEEVFVRLREVSEMMSPHPSAADVSSIAVSTGIHALESRAIDEFVEKIKGNVDFPNLIIEILRPSTEFRYFSYEKEVADKALSRRVNALFAKMYIAILEKALPYIPVPEEIFLDSPNLFEAVNQAMILADISTDYELIVLDLIEHIKYHLHDLEVAMKNDSPALIAGMSSARMQQDLDNLTMRFKALDGHFGI